MAKETYTCKEKVWIYPGAAAWHFVRIGKAHSEAIKKAHGKNRRGFGSIPVSVTLGTTTWETSIFPDSHSGQYLLPLKAQVRKKEGVADGDTISFSIRVRSLPSTHKPNAQRHNRKS